MSLAALIRAMATAGAPAEAIALAVEAIEAAGADRDERRRVDRERKRRVRGLSTECPQTIQGQSEEILPLPPETKVSPTPPSKTQTTNPNQEPPIVPQKSARKANLGPAKGAFAQFWAEYPLKVGKLAAEKAYATAWAEVLKVDPDADPAAEILGGLKRGKALFEPEYIPHPSTWLNKGRWMDVAEIDLPDSTGPPKFDLQAFEERRRRQREAFTEDAT